MKHLSIATKVNKLFGLMTSILIIGGISAYWIQRAVIVDSYHNLNLDFVLDLSRTTARKLSIYEKNLNQVLITTQLRETLFPDPNSHHHAKMQDALHLLPYVESITVSDLQGQTFMTAALSNAAAPHNDAPQQQPWFKKVISYGSPAQFSFSTRASDVGGHAIHVSLPIYSQALKPKGMIALSIRPSLITHFFQTIQGPSSGRLSLSDTEGTLIAGIPPAASLTTADLTAYSGIHEGHCAFYYYSNLSNPEWYVIYEVPKRSLNRFVFHESKSIVYFLTFSLAINTLCWLYMRRRIQQVEKHLVTGLMKATQVPGDLNIADAIHLVSERRNTLRKESLIDGLTGLNNRRALDNDLPSLIEDGATLVAMLDIDYFKSINDTYGHQTGDTVLKTFAAIAEAQFPPQSTRIYRYGGEEFVIVFVRVTPSQALEMLEQLRLSIAQYQWHQGPHQVTFSAGLASCADADAISLADARLYEAKRSGRNRIIYDDVSRPDDEPSLG
ncbi:sensor domain-containing diguanylate cyclase [Vibrio furnissii]|uniref:sensor domain-containing diguanylate cyclase n=1 Tax=Vibrio furnissii TaxID=29494 RepID=UPI001EECA020|nr:sensor domain-containing diguanylate cyclase [Vibrio furnissii]MCG6233319.1 sensor domain-containing diguanylate cyclase [Vibrio furnissii]MCG6259096.1 sensor domain-containing diguanylate cyclase [Vibrio furnissii]